MLVAYLRVVVIMYLPILSKLRRFIRSITLLRPPVTVIKSQCAEPNLTTTEEIGEHSRTLAEPDKQNSGPVGLSKMKASKAKETHNVEVYSNVDKTINDGLDTLTGDKPIPMDSSPQQVLNALMRFRRFLLRTADVDGKKLRVDVLDSQFIATLSRLHLKFAKATDPTTLVFPTAFLFLNNGDRSIVLPNLMLFLRVSSRPSFLLRCLSLASWYKAGSPHPKSTDRFPL
ncbi:unnamed protein product [Cochlearia groenlandica]